MMEITKKMPEMLALTPATARPVIPSKNESEVACLVNLLNLAIWLKITYPDEATKITSQSHQKFRINNI
jgi:hypothetical protein